MKSDRNIKAAPEAPAVRKGLKLPQRRLVAGIGIIVFMCVYVVLVSDIGRHLPPSGLIQLLFYGLAGTLWGVPVLPLISWSEAYKPKSK